MNEVMYISYQTVHKATALLYDNRLLKIGITASVNMESVSEQYLNAYMQKKLTDIERYLRLTDFTRMNIRNSGMIHRIKTGMAEQGVTLRQFLRTTEGKAILTKYDFDVEHKDYVKNFIDDFTELEWIHYDKNMFGQP